MGSVTINPGLGQRALSGDSALRHEAVERGFVATLHRQFRFQARSIATERGQGQRVRARAERDGAVEPFDAARDVNALPSLRVAEIRDGRVVVRAPKERHRVETLIFAEHVERRGFTLAGCDDPMLDADLVAAAGVGKARHISGGEDAGRAGA